MQQHLSTKRKSFFPIFGNKTFQSLSASKRVANFAKPFHTRCDNNTVTPLNVVDRLL